MLGYNFDLKKESQAVQDQWNDSYRTKKFREAATAVAKVIKSTRADIIVLTEVGNKHDVAILKDELTKIHMNYRYSTVGKSSPRDQTKQHVAILSVYKLNNITKQLPGREGYLEEPDDPDSENDTGVSKSVRVEVSVDGKSFIIYGIHLSSERGGHEKDQQRVAQASIVRRHMLNDLNLGKHVIVAGDLNDGRGQPAIRRIRGLDDIFPDLLQTGHTQYFPKKELLIALTNIPDDAVITIAVDDRDYQAAKKQQPNMDTVYLGIPGDHSYDEKGDMFSDVATERPDIRKH